MVETDHELILMDPWMNQGAFANTWLQYPSNSHIGHSLIDAVWKTDKRVYYYISHEHQDHFDVTFIQNLCADKTDITFIIPFFKRKYLREWFERNNKSYVINVRDGDKVKLHSGYLQVFIDDTVREADSAILLHHKEIGGATFNFLNMNDCHLHDRVLAIKNNIGHINILAAAFSGASWYPVCYGYTPNVMANKITEVVQNRFSNLIKVLEDVGPDYYVPSAGPAAFVDKESHRMYIDIRRNAFPDAEIFHQRLITHFMIGKKLPALPFVYDYHNPGGVLTTTPDKYMQLRSHVLPTTSTESSPLDLQGIAIQLKDKLDNFTLVDQIGVSNLIIIPSDITGTFAIDVDFRDRDICIIEYNPARDINMNRYVISASAATLGLLSSKTLTWYEWLLTMKVGLHRVPDVFDPVLDGFLVCEPEDLPAFCEQYKQNSQRGERIKVWGNDGKQYEISKYCPHAGADLTNAFIHQNCVVCPKHGWKFELSNGGKSITGPCTIGAKEI
jgi:UDP-MurNAc hydroxylase